MRCEEVGDGPIRSHINKIMETDDNNEAAPNRLGQQRTNRAGHGYYHADGSDLYTCGDCNRSFTKETWKYHSKKRFDQQLSCEDAMIDQRHLGPATIALVAGGGLPAMHAHPTAANAAMQAGHSRAGVAPGVTTSVGDSGGYSEDGGHLLGDAALQAMSVDQEEDEEGEENKEDSSGKL